MNKVKSLSDAALEVLQTPDATQKAQKTREFKEQYDAGIIKGIHVIPDLPHRPARPDKPELLMPRDMPKRGKAGTTQSKIALLHAIAHIELNAIDLAWDIIARFSHFYETSESFALPIEFYEDWLKVADDEAKHFLMLNGRLADFDASYGDLPAHDGLWESAEKTAHDFAARLAIVPMVLEARGLDVTPNMIALMRAQNDDKTADMLQIIHDDEITHVRAGTLWFEAWCAHHNRDIEAEFQALVKQYFNAALKRPFNHPSRFEAGMLQDWYEPLADIEF